MVEDVEKPSTFHPKGAPLQLLAAMLNSGSHAVTCSYFQREARDLNIYVETSHQRILTFKEKE